MANLLVLNSGSSSYKAALFQLENEKDRNKPLWKNRIDLHLNPSEQQENLFESLPIDKSNIHAIGHRIVHGGEKFYLPTVITDEVKKELSALDHLAPLHNPIQRKEIDIINTIFPGKLQYAVFDTAFHHTISKQNYTYAIPPEWRNKGIRRFGFHGINHAYCMEEAARRLEKDIKDVSLITCHLGNGCSLAAIKNGICIDTTMGYTPLEGLVMGTRGGSIDPGVIVEMAKEHSAEELDRLLNQRCGLKGLCGLEDMRNLIDQAEKGNGEAQLAFEVFIHTLKKFIGAMYVQIPEPDAIVFTAGIGENSQKVREETCKGLEHLGIGQKVQIMVIEANEELAIAQKYFKLTPD